ncbi:MAG: transglutaminase-like domain-containing protein [Methanobrevibacter sp.]|nr:transglutaminase-like domain-containing protein [Methanobrevibacter sp.]
MVQVKLAKSGLEIYETKDTNIEQITKEDEKEGFVLHNGQITEIAYYDNIMRNSFEEDYEDISSNGSVTFPSVNEQRFYKGKKVCLKKAWQSENKTLRWDDLDNALLGFIIEQKYSTDNVKLKISGMSKLLEQEKEFSFKKTKRSKIIKTIIEASGLKCKINTKGLKDDSIDFTNVSSSSSSSDTEGQGEDIDAKVKEIIGNETDDYQKMILIHEWLRENNNYSSYECSHKSSASECLKSLKNNCADTSLLSCAMYRSAGLESQVVHGPNHFWTIIIINGKEYASDATSHQRKINQVWKGLKYSKKCGDKPSC